MRDLLPVALVVDSERLGVLLEHLHGLAALALVQTLVEEAEARRLETVLELVGQRAGYVVLGLFLVLGLHRNGQGLFFVAFVRIRDLLAIRCLLCSGLKLLFGQLLLILFRRWWVVLFLQRLLSEFLSGFLFRLLLFLLLGIRLLRSLVLLRGLIGCTTSVGLLRLIGSILSCIIFLLLLRLDFLLKRAKFKSCFG